MTRSRSLVTLATIALALAGCAEPLSPAAGGDPATLPSPASPGERNLVAPGYDGRFTTTATVLESPGHGPQLCYTVAESYPPQCGGPDIVGWDWSAVSAESASGTTWGTYQLVGTFDGERFTLTAPATPVEPGAAAPSPPPDLTPPCPKPTPGWQPVEPATTTHEALQQAFAQAADSPAYGGGWVYPYDGDESETDPARLVLTLRFTEDLDQHREQIQEIWGGALCVASAQRTEAELHRLTEQAVGDLPHVVTSGVDVVHNAAAVSLLVATTEQQAALDSQYGPGAVLLSALLAPID